jgi:uncharacterized protein (TIRG00374 family)
MKRKQIIVLLFVLVVLGVLLYLQIRTWRRFDWEKFREGSEGIDWFKVLIGVAFIYLADFLRAIRWKIFLRPTVPDAEWTALVAPQYVGFAGLSLLGRPGELIRPYLIGRKTHSTFESQMAIWTVERLFDTGAVVVIFLADIFLVQSIRDVDYYDKFRKAGFLIGGGFGLLVAFVVALWFYGPSIASFLSKGISRRAPHIGGVIEARIRAFSEGLNTVHNKWSFIEVTFLSLGIWLLVLLAYRQVTGAYPPETDLPTLDLPQVTLLMGASVAGGVLQLPVIGGGSQLATITVLKSVLGISVENAVSCGILLWLVTFMSVAPLGLALARSEHVSLRRVTAESQRAEEAIEAGIVPPEDVPHPDPQ